MTLEFLNIRIWRNNRHLSVKKPLNFKLFLRWPLASPITRTTTKTLFYQIVRSFLWSCQKKFQDQTSHRLIISLKALFNLLSCNEANVKIIENTCVHVIPPEIKTYLSETRSRITAGVPLTGNKIRVNLRIVKKSSFKF